MNEDLVHALEQLLTASAAQDGWRPMREISACFNVGPNNQRLRCAMRILVEDGRIEVRRAPRLANDGILRPVPEYRLKAPLNTEAK